MALYMTCTHNAFLFVATQKQVTDQWLPTLQQCCSCLYCGIIIYFICRIHVIFGHVLQGQEIVSEIEIQRIDDKSRPLVDVKIINCGELIPKAKAKGTGYVSID